MARHHTWHPYLLHVPVDGRGRRSAPRASISSVVEQENVTAHGCVERNPAQHNPVETCHITHSLHRSINPSRPSHHELCLCNKYHRTKLLVRLTQPFPSTVPPTPVSASATVNVCNNLPHFFNTYISASRDVSSRHLVSRQCD